jgi:GT2 family glycosyltransferase
MGQLVQSIQVVIVNWERSHDTIECIQSVMQSHGVAVSILVVDNGSRDDSVDRIKHKCPEAELILLPTNLGFAGGYNAGIEYFLASDAEYIFMLNNDTVIFPDTIHTLVVAMQEYDVTVPKILFHDSPSQVWAAGARWRSFPPSVVMIGYERRDRPKYNVPRPLDYATGCALMLKRQVIESVGDFDLDYQNYQEDYDLCYRIRAAGFRIGYVPTASLLHKVSMTLGEGSPQKWRLLGRNTVLFYRKHNRFPSWMLWSFLIWVSIRETLKRQSTELPDFWRGVREGLATLKRGKLEQARR